MAARAALVTGGTGFVGTHLITALVDRGWEVRTCGRRPRPENLPEEVEYRVADLAGDEPLEGLFEGVSHLFHLAGASSSRSSQEEMMRANVVGTERLLAAAGPLGLERILHMSSTSIYGEEVQHPLPVREDVEPHPSRGYGKAKWGAEQAMWRAARAGAPVQVVRPVSVFGPGNTKLLASAILDTALERFAGLDTLAVPREPVEQRLVHIDDLVAACLHLVETDAPLDAAFNVCCPTYPTSHDLVAMLADQFGLTVELNDGGGIGSEERRRVHERMLARGMRADIILTDERFRLMGKVNPNNRLSLDALVGTGFEFRRADLPAAIADVVAWYRDHGWIV